MFPGLDEREFYDNLNGPVPAPTTYDQHNQWHTINGWNAVCPLDCGAGEDDYYDDELTHTIRCGHCKQNHGSAAAVRDCARNDYASRGKPSYCLTGRRAATDPSHGRRAVAPGPGLRRRAGADLPHPATGMTEYPKEG